MSSLVASSGLPLAKYDVSYNYGREDPPVNGNCSSEVCQLPSRKMLVDDGDREERKNERDKERAPGGSTRKG